jgi:glycosyltransferase involved in cell wall biosynthesis
MALIAIDARIVRSWSSGIGVYTLRLIEGLVSAAPAHRYVLLTAPGAPPLADGLPVQQRAVACPGGALGQHAWLPRVLKELGADVLLSMHPASAPLASGCPRLTFVHDLIPLTQPRQYSPAKRLYYRTVLPWSLRGAARVLVDSESTRRDCERLLGLPSERMRVVYGGVAEQYQPLGGKEGGPLARPYILYAGNKRPHKNVDRLIEAFALLRRDAGIDCDLVIAGPDRPGHVETDTTRLRALAHRLSLDGGVRFVGEVPDNELPALYRGAQVFAFLSAYEGFGLPPLEAMACGTPVIALNTSSLPEVVGGGGLLLDCADPLLVASTLRDVLTDRSLRDRLARRAVWQASKFSWRKTTQAVAEEIERAQQRRPRR